MQHPYEKVRRAPNVMALRLGYAMIGAYLLVGSAMVYTEAHKKAMVAWLGTGGFLGEDPVLGLFRIASVMLVVLWLLYMRCVKGFAGAPYFHVILQNAGIAFALWLPLLLMIPAGHTDQGLLRDPFGMYRLAAGAACLANVFFGSIVFFGYYKEIKASPRKSRKDTE